MKKLISKKRPTRKSTLDPETSNLDRRTFVKLVPAIGATVLTTSNLGIAAALAQTPTPTPTPSPTPAPLRVTKDMLRQAEKFNRH